MASIKSILFTTFIIGLIVLITYYMKKLLNFYRGTGKKFKLSSLPLIGTAHYFFGNNADIADKMMKYLMLQRSSFKRVTVGNQLYVIISDMDILKIVLSSPNAVEKGAIYRFIRPLLGEGLLSAPSEKWRVRRKLLAPTFNMRILESFMEVFQRQSYILMKEMEVELGRNEFKVFNYVSRCTLDIVCETAMGVTSDTQITRNSNYVDSVKRIMEIMYIRIFKIWLHPDIIFNFTSLATEQKVCVKYLQNQTDEVIRKKKEQLRNTSDLRNIESTYDSKIPWKAFLDLLMDISDEGTSLTDEELREEVDTMMVTGNDTTATVDTFVMLMLANFPEIQQKCYDELCDIFGDNINERTEITLDDINRMEYLERVIKETMRLFPPTPILVRTVTKNLDIEQCILPIGCSVLIPIIKLHRQSDIWDNPLEFNPDRFLPDEVAKRHPFSYLPFSAGPRNCIGLQYGMMSMKVLLSTLLREYVLQKDVKVKIQDIKLQGTLVLKVVDPVKIKIMRRYTKNKSV